MRYLLHISDLHLINNAMWNNMREAILNKAREIFQNVPEHDKLLVLTGDFCFFGKPFDIARDFIKDLADAMGIDRKEDVFLVPGNHDIKAVDEDGRAFRIQQLKLDPMRLEEKKAMMLKDYGAFCRFTQELDVYPDGSDLPARVHVRTWRDKLHLLHLNTTLIADGATKKEQRVDTTTATSAKIRDALKKDGLPVLALGHNSFFDLREKDQNALRSPFLTENVSAYLCGDRHKRDTNPNEKNIFLTNNFSSATIPNIVCYRSSTDDKDEYSDFGMILHCWDETTNRVELSFFRWDEGDQAELKKDGEDEYRIKNPPASFTPTPVPTCKPQISLWQSSETLLELIKKPVKDSYVRTYLLGGSCYWNLAASNFIVKREIVQTLLQVAAEPGVYILTAPGGEGKSTVLMQFCVELIRKKFLVYYYQGEKEPKLPEPVLQGSVFVLDNPPDSPSIKQLIEAVNEDGTCTLIVGMRDNEWKLLEKKHRIPTRIIEQIPMKELTEREAAAFANCICKNLRHAKTQRQIKEVFWHNSYGFLYAAMLLSVSDKNTLKEIAHQIIDTLSERSENGLLLLSHIVFCEHLDISFNRDLYQDVCRRLSLSPNDAERALGREITKNGRLYQTRHEKISGLFYQMLFSDSRILYDEDVENILTNLFEYYLDRYHRFYGALQAEAWSRIRRLCEELDLIGTDAREYLIGLILDEMKSDPSRTQRLASLHTCIKNEDFLLLFYRKCFDRGWLFPGFVHAWCALLQKSGAPWTYQEPYSPAWILRKACVNVNADSSAWLFWAQQEKKRGGIGKYEAENSARWIYREACVNHGADGAAWLAWAQLEAESGNIGNYDEENSARWIYREACVNHTAFGGAWLAWAQLEAEKGNIGNYDEENSARWIFQNGIRKNPDSAVLYSPYAEAEMLQGYAEYARMILRTAAQYSNWSINTLAIIEYYCGNLEGDDEYCVRRLIDRIEQSKEFNENSYNAICSLYYCYNLLGDVEQADIYFEQLQQHPLHGSSIALTKMKQWDQLCRETLSHLDTPLTST